MNILQEIVEHKREEVASQRQKLKVSALMEMEHFHRRALPFHSALVNAMPFAIIAEFKKSSPSAGRLARGAVPEETARAYESNGAAAISVLTDERFFSGSLDDLTSVRRAVQSPILRKDFIINEYQLFEAKAYGADAVLLIAAILERSQLRDLFEAATELKLECLVELYEQSEIDSMDFDRMKLVGINNRDLRTFTVDLNHSLSLAKLLPKDITVVSESGIKTPNDLKRLREVGIHAALIGEHFMKAEHPGNALKAMLDGLNDATED